MQGTCVPDDLREGSDRGHGLDIAAEGNRLAPRVDEVEGTVSAGDLLLVLQLLAGNDAVASTATVPGDIAVVVASCLEVDHGACLAIQGVAQAVVACSCQEVEAALASAKKMPCSQRWEYEDCSQHSSSGENDDPSTEAGALQAARAVPRGWHDIWEGPRIEVIEVPFQTAEATQYLKKRGGGLLSRPVLPVRGS